MASPAVPPCWVVASQALAWPVGAFRAMACLAVSQGGALASQAPDPLVTASPATDPLVTASPATDFQAV